jgi:CBS domain-containing protein
VLPQLSALGDVLIAQDLAMDDPPVVHPDDDLDFAMRQFERSHTEELPVVDPAEPGKPIGSLVRHELIKAYNQAIAEDDMTASAAGRMEASLGRRMTETLGGFVLLQAEVPAEMQGRTLAELDFRSKYKSQVLLVCHSDGTDQGGYTLPERSTRLEAGDRILVFGPRKDVARIRNL